MSAVIQPETALQATPVPPDMLTLAHGDPQQVLAFDGRQRITLGQFLAHVRGLAAVLPTHSHVVNLCEDRYQFSVALAAAAMRGQTTLLPSSRATATVLDVCQAYPDSYCIGEHVVDLPPPRYWRLPDPLPRLEGAAIEVVASALAVIGFTSGSTGIPQANPKTWASFQASTRQNLAALRHLWPAGERAQVVATVPPQHMYGLELSVLLPLLGDVAMHTARPFFPQDVAAALQQAGPHALLVTTPVHMRALVESGVTFPPVAGIVSATAALPQPLAAATEACFGSPVHEVFGSTESCIIAHRRTAQDMLWTLMPGVRLTPQPDGAQVQAPHLAAPVVLSDLVELQADGRFALRGRSVDLIEIAGKRASLGDLTHRLLAVPGVRDGVVLQLDPDSHGVRRIAALVVADPGVGRAQILRALRCRIDPVFLPRVLKLVPALPRNDTGKLPRAQMLAMLGRG